jgi:hypothetical protein
MVSAPATSTTSADQPTSQQDGPGPVALVGLLFLGALWLSKGYIERRSMTIVKPR